MPRLPAAAPAILPDRAVARVTACPKPGSTTRLPAPLHG